MKCRVCGQPSSGTGGLCGDCTRALARARDGPAAVRQEPAGARRAANKIHLAAPVSPAPAPVPVLRMSRQRALVLWAVIAVAVGAILVGGTHILVTPRGHETGVADQTAGVPAARQNRGAEGDPQKAEPEPPPATADMTTSHGSRSSADSRGSTVGRAGARAAPRAPKAQPGAGPNGSGQVADDARRDDALAASGPDAAPSTQLARTTGASPAASNDDGQALASALEKCSEEQFVAGVICEQKARLRFCDGKWGRVPQCTPKPKVD